ncbi:MAG: glycosyltransferase family 2 protein [Anaeroplasmataceae bacterium]|nr:glycosyltransferase family 2 protein [Anaeroplasmataceae bacterium]
MRIAVIMSSYNGEKFIEEQINSILGQTNVEVGLYIRDDGSSDGTLDILKKYSQNSNIHLVQFENDTNLGVCYSFLKTLQYAIEQEPNTEYFSFADQDDVWLPQKLEKAIEKIKSYKNDYVVYYSNKTFVNKTLELINKEKIKFYDDFFEAYCSSLASGCTMVFNKKMAKLSLTPLPQNAEFHDSWIYRLNKYVHGKIVFDKNSYILYRQHGNNVCGSATCIVQEKNFKKNVELYKSAKTTWRQSLFDEMELYHGELACKDAQKYIYLMKNYKKKFSLKLNLLFNKYVIKRGIIFYFNWFIKVILNKI